MNKKDFTWVEKRFGTRFANILKRLGGLSKDDTDGSIEYKDEQGNITKLVTDSNFSSLLAKNGLIEVKWQELKDKRDNGELTPGSLYRITDYQCTTTQENTRSAGHQFDIVLLALSENKLAEEGWAMMHDNIYDVTFSDGVTKKCYVYEASQGSYNIVDVSTLLGTEGIDETITIDEENKIVTITGQDYVSSLLTDENVPYNYFQNSNLSAWKVWYCLDNDKSRFGWADDSVDESIPTFITRLLEKGEINTHYRDSADDRNNLFAWKGPNDGEPCYTASQTPSVGDTIYHEDGTDSGFTVNSFTPAHEGTGLPNGRGVIYRLIDEWNIDYPCDFKNMQTLIPMDSNDNIAMENPVTSKYCYAFTDNTNGKPEDLSIKGHAINIKVKANLVVETNSTMYFSPATLFYTKHKEYIYNFSDITVGIANTTIFINRGNAINILDGSNNVILTGCVNICIGNDSYNVMLNGVSDSSFGSNCQNIQLAYEEGLNYGNNGVELATKDDLN